MALLLPPDARVLDASGVAVNGGQVRVYNANTTTLSSLFSDAGLTVALSNPVVCNSTGYPSSNGTTPTLIFAASANYDIAFLNTVASGSAVLRSWEDVPSLGSDNATFSRDFTNSRTQTEGVAGTVWIEVGDASPDNTGGTGRLSGWNRTQADSWTVDAALANMGTSAGALKENSKKLPGVIYTDATTVTAQASLVIALANEPTGVTAWQIDFWDYAQSVAAADLAATLSFDGGGSYAGGVSDYSRLIFTADSAGTSVSNSTGATTMNVMAALGGNTNKPGRATYIVTTPNSGNNVTRVTGEAYGESSTALFSTQIINGVGPASSGRATHIKFTPTSGTITLKYRVTPLRGSGET